MARVAVEARLPLKLHFNMGNSEWADSSLSEPSRSSFGVCRFIKGAPTIGTNGVSATDRGVAQSRPRRSSLLSLFNADGIRFLRSGAVTDTLATQQRT